jgi:hypothetical protein
MKLVALMSRLIDLASSGKHHEIKVDPTNLQRLILRMDTRCPYRGEEEIREIPDPEFQGGLAGCPAPHQNRPPGCPPRPAELTLSFMPGRAAYAIVATLPRR